MNKTSCLVIMLLAGALSAVEAGWVQVTGGGAVGQPPDVQLLSDGAQECSFHVTLYGFYLDTVQIPGGTFSRIRLPGATCRQERGNPELPDLVVSLIIPDNGGVNWSVQNLAQTELSILPVIPSKGIWSINDDPDTIPWIFNAVYHDSSWFPNTLQEPRPPFVMCDFRGASICLNVFQHNPAEHGITVARSFDVRLAFDVPKTPHTGGVTPDFDGIYAHTFLNHNIYPGPSRVHMAIITADALWPQAWRLRDWKMKKGILVDDFIRVPSGLARNPGIIKTRMQNLWSTGTRDFLLVGDVDSVPTCHFSGSCPDPAASDDIYVQFTPGDSFPDAHISRISGNTLAEVRAQVDKILNYEKLDGPPPQNPDYANNALVLCPWSFDSIAWPIYDDLNIKCAPSMLSWPHLDSSDIAGFVNSYGCGYVSWTGDGDFTGWWRYDTVSQAWYRVFKAADTSLLGNQNMYPFVYSAACLTCDIDSPCCLGEAWMRKSHAGAVGFYGGTTRWLRQHLWADTVAVHGLTHDWFLWGDFPNTLGQFVDEGAVWNMVNNGISPFSNMLLGDATMQCRLGHQERITMTHDPCQVFPGGTLWVGVRYMNGDPCAGAAVCLWKDDDAYNALQVTDVQGQTTFSLPSNLTPGTMYVTATKYNTSACEGTVMIVSGGGGGQASSPEDRRRCAHLSVLPSVSDGDRRVSVPAYANRVTLYDSQGRALVELPLLDQYVWTPRAARGVALPRGVYFVKATGLRQSEVRKILVTE